MYIIERDIKPNNDLHGTILPSATNTYQLGDADHRYNRAYLKNIYTDYIYPVSSSDTIGDANNPFLCMYMTTTNAYSDYAVVNKAWIKNNVDYFTLVDSETVTSTKTGHSLYSSRKFSDYRILMFYVMDANGYRAFATIPRVAFSTSPYKYVSMTWVNSSNQQFWVEATYKSDTEIYIQGKSGLSGITLNCLGFLKWA